MKTASATASRSAGGCTISPHSHGVLAVSCDRGDQATLTYSFSLSNRGSIKGTPWCEVQWMGFADVHRACHAAGRTLRVTVTVTDGTAVLSTVSVGYYT